MQLPKPLKPSRCTKALAEHLSLFINIANRIGVGQREEKVGISNLLKYLLIYTKTAILEH